MKATELDQHSTTLLSRELDDEILCIERINELLFDDSVGKAVRLTLGTSKDEHQKRAKRLQTQIKRIRRQPHMIEAADELPKFDEKRFMGNMSKVEFHDGLQAFIFEDGKETPDVIEKPVYYSKEEAGKKWSSALLVTICVTVI